MSPYFFILPTLLAIIPILIVFKVTIERIKEDPSVSRKAQVHFMIGVAVSEVIPIILFVYGFINLTPVNDIEELYLPGIIILLIMGIAAFFILLQRVVDVDEDTKPLVMTFTTLTFAVSASLPILSIVALVMMLP